MTDIAARARRDPALVKRLLSTGRSYQLPTSMLSVAQRRARNNAQAQKAISDPTKPLQGVNLVNSAHTITDGQYDPALADLARQSTEAQQRETQGHRTIGGIYDTINKYQTAALGQQNAQQANGAQTLAGITSGAIGQVDAAAEQQRQQAAKDAAVRGTGLDGGSLDALAARVAAAKGDLTARGQIASANQSANAQTNDAVLGGIGAATQQRGGEEQSNLRNATQGTLDKLAASRSDIAGKKGASFADTLMKLRQQATDEYYTAAGLGLRQQSEQDATAGKAAQIKSTAKTAKASRDAQAKKWGRTVNKYGVTNAAWFQWGKSDAGKAKRQQAIDSYKKTGGKGKGGKAAPGTPGSATNAAQGSAQDGITSAARIAARYKNAGVSEADVLANLTQGSPASGTTVNDGKGTSVHTSSPAVKPVKSLYLQAALDLVYRGVLSPASVKALHARGIKVNALGLKELAAQLAAAGVGAGAGNVAGLLHPKPKKP